MDYQQEQKKLFSSEISGQNYDYIKKNQYHRMFSGFIHDQNLRIKLSIKNHASMIKIQQILSFNNKNYQMNGSFFTWNLINRQNQFLKTKNQRQQKQLKQQENQNTQKIISEYSLSQKFVYNPSIIFGISQGLTKIEYRHGQKYYKKFKYSPFFGIDVSKNFDQIKLTLGFMHKSKHVNLIPKITIPAYSLSNYLAKIKFQYCKNQIYFGSLLQVSPSWQIKLNKGLLGYQMTQKDYFYFRMQMQNVISFFKSHLTYQKFAFYYLRKINQNIKFGIGVKTINSTDNATINLILQTKQPYNIKAKIDNKLNTCMSIKKQINESSSISYGISINNLFGKKSRIQSGIVYQFNA